MRTALPLLLAALLAPAGAGSAAAQTQIKPQISAAAAAAVAPSPAPARQVGRARAYTGLEIAGSASVGSDGVVVPAYPTIRAVHAASPGQQAGVDAGDVIIEVNGQDSREQGALWWQPGVRYTLRLRSGDQEREVVMIPAPPRERPAAPSS